MDDRNGYLDAFGTPCRVKGLVYAGIIEDDYAQAELGSVRVATNTIICTFKKPDVERMSLAQQDTVSVYDSESDSYVDYTVTSLQPNTSGFTDVRLIEQ